MKKRTQIEAELAELAQQVSSKSNADAASAVLELYKEFALLAAEDTFKDRWKPYKKTFKRNLKRVLPLFKAKQKLPNRDCTKKYYWWRRQSTLFGRCCGRNWKRGS